MNQVNALNNGLSPLPNLQFPLGGSIPNSVNSVYGGIPPNLLSTPSITQPIFGLSPNPTASGQATSNAAGAGSGTALRTNVPNLATGNNQTISNGTAGATAPTTPNPNKSRETPN